LVATIRKQLNKKEKKPFKNPTPPLCFGYSIERSRRILTWPLTSNPAFACNVASHSVGVNLENLVIGMISGLYAAQEACKYSCICCHVSLTTIVNRLHSKYALAFLVGAC